VTEVTNNNGGPATVADFNVITDAGTLVFDAGTALGSTTTYTATPLVVDSNTPYTLGSSPFAGYTQTAFVCTDDITSNVVAIPFTLNEGQNVTCVMTADDEDTSLTVAVNVTNDNGEIRF